MEMTNFRKEVVETTVGVVYRLLTNLPVSDDEAARILKAFVKLHPPQKNAKAGDVIIVPWH
jgi:predicted oxidoreductase (fatty acid repression mutant protein)